MISVGDGDTQRVEEAGRKLIIRVAFVNAPETAQKPLRLQAWEAFSSVSSHRLHNELEDPDQRA